MARDNQDVAYRGRRRWSGNYGRVWLGGELVFEIQSFELKVTADRDDVIIGISKDSKTVSLTGEGTITIKKVFDRGYNQLLEDWKAGHDTRVNLIASLAVDNVWFNEIPVLHFTKGEVVEDELPIGFTPEDLNYLSTVEL